MNMTKDGHTLYTFTVLCQYFNIFWVFLDIKKDIDVWLVFCLVNLFGNLFGILSVFDNITPLFGLDALYFSQVWTLLIEYHKNFTGQSS